MGKIKDNINRNPINILYDSLIFDTSLRLVIPQHKTALKKLFNKLKLEGYKKDEKLIQLEILIANLIVQFKVKPVSISKSKNKWGASIYNDLTYTVLIQQLIPALAKMNLLTEDIGFYNSKKMIGKETRISATETLLNMFDKLPNHISRQYKEVIELKGIKTEYKDKDGNIKYKPRELIDYRKDKIKEPQHVKETRQTILLVNEVNSRADIMYKDFKLCPILKAVYVEKFFYHGRFYTSGTRYYQGYSSKERKTFTIDNEPVCELDYTALHPNLLYAKAGIQFPTNKDAYSLVNPDPKLRLYLKMILLRMINCRNDAQAIYSAEKWLQKQPAYLETLESIGASEAAPLLKAIKTTHKPIAEYLCKGIFNGRRITKLDSAIASEVIKHFASKGIAILPVHDSFIIKAKHRDELKMVMQQAYTNHTKFDIKIK